MRFVSPGTALALLLACLSAAPATAQHLTSTDASSDQAGARPAADDDPWLAVDREISQTEKQRVVNRPAGRKSSGVLAARSGPANRSWTRTIGALAGVVGLILLLAWGYRAVASGNVSLVGKVRRPGLIEVLSRTTLSPRQSLCLVRVGPRVILVGQSQDNLSALDVIEDAGLASDLAGQAARGGANSNAAEFQQSLEQEASGYGDDAGAPTKDRAPELQHIDAVRQGVLETIERIRRSSARA